MASPPQTVMAASRHFVRSSNLSERVPEFGETKAAEVFDVGCGKVGDTVMPKGECKAGINDVT